MGEKKVHENMLREIVAGIDVFAFLSVQELLASIYAEMKKQSPRYSYRTFSADLGFGETNYLHLICTCKRQLSPRSAQQVVQHLGLHAERRQWFLSLVEHKGARKTEQRTAGMRKAFEIRQRSIQDGLTRDELQFFAQWYHPVVREMAGRADFSANPQWIANHIRPRITPDQAKSSLELLLRLGYLQSDADGRISQTHSTIRVPEGATHLAVHNYHQEMLQLSARCLSEVEPEQRDINALTVPLSAEQVAEVKQLLRSLRKKIVEISEQDSAGKEIYQLNTQVFPVTRTDE